MEKFKAVHNINIGDPNGMFRRISDECSRDIGRWITMEEIKTGVWACGSDKAPGPDGFNFAFIKHYWELFKMDIFEFVAEFFDRAFISSLMGVGDFHPISLIRVQYKILAKILAHRLATVAESVVSIELPTFVKNRQILDGPLMVNELMAWFKKKKKQMMILNIDFEKAYDSISWNYLDQVMRLMNFPPIWCECIRACLHSARSSVMINGSPTKEFRLFRGLRKGDSLSPFLFILAMGGLHVAIENACAMGLF